MISSKRVRLLTVLSVMSVRFNSCFFAIVTVNSRIILLSCDSLRGFSGHYETIGSKKIGSKYA